MKFHSNKKSNSSKGHIEKEVHVLLKIVSGKEEGTESGGIEKFQPAFNLQKELEKVKILVPLTELLNQPTYKAQVSQFMHPSASAPTHDSLNLQEERPMVAFGPL